MTKQEFEKLTGLDVDLAQYEVINGMYMCSDNQTKQEFCKCFVEMGLMAHVNYVVNLKDDNSKIARERYEAEQQRNMWRDRYCQAEERAEVLETRIKAIAEMVKGGEE